MKTVVYNGYGPIMLHAARALKWVEFFRDDYSQAEKSEFINALMSGRVNTKGYYEYTVSAASMRNPLLLALVSDKESASIIHVSNRALLRVIEGNEEDQKMKKVICNDDEFILLDAFAAFAWMEKDPMRFNVNDKNAFRLALTVRASENWYYFYKQTSLTMRNAVFVAIVSDAELNKRFILNGSALEVKDDIPHETNKFEEFKASKEEQKKKKNRFPSYMKPPSDDEDNDDNNNELDWEMEI